MKIREGSETWERIETRDPKPTARTQLSVVALATVPSVFSRTLWTMPSNENNYSYSCSSYIHQPVIAPSTNRTDYNLANGSRYTVLKTPVVPAWMTKSSTYSLLSSADSTEDVRDVLPAMVHPYGDGGPRSTLRSESVQNFVLSSRPATRCPPPMTRSQTTTRFNDEVTSDYASQLNVANSSVSVVGIPNPNYDEFSATCDQRGGYFSGSYLHRIHFILGSKAIGTNAKSST